MKPALKILLAGPRGFCAGVDRAIHTVEKALQLYGAPVYVRHEIVHNTHVVKSLERQGAVFVDELSAVPQDRPVIFSAHGVAKAVVQEASARQLVYLDATCPLVSKVHREAERHHQAGRLVILVGHQGHPEVVGTLGQLPPGAVLLVETTDGARALQVSDQTLGQPLAYVTQTTLSIDETSAIIAILKERFPHIHEPKRGDICYATTNRQLAVRALAPEVDRMLIVGSPNSSNAQRLVEVARTYGCSESRLVESVAEVDWTWLAGGVCLGVSAGASTPESLVQEIVSACRAHFDVEVEERLIAEETLKFNLPRPLVQSPRVQA